MGHTERKGGKKGKKESKKADKFTGAALYRSAEQEYQYFLFGSIAALDDPDPSLTDTQRQIESYVEAAKASAVLFEMTGLQKNYGLVVGGENKDLRVGDRHEYDPKKHFFTEEPGMTPPAPGETVVVFMSEIATVKKGKVRTLLPAAFTLPLIEQPAEPVVKKDIFLPANPRPVGK